jgi:hypothetical protein
MLTIITTALHSFVAVGLALQFAAVCFWGFRAARSRIARSTKRTPKAAPPGAPARRVRHFARDYRTALRAHRAGVVG